MPTFEGISKNLRFMLVQVRSQLEQLGELIDTGAARSWKKLLSGEDYVDTQKSMIESHCFDYFRSAQVDNTQLDTVRAINVVTSNLERIADLSINIGRQLQRLDDRNTLTPYEPRGYLEALRGGLDMVPTALFDRDSAVALQICQIEDDLDRRYGGHLQELIAALRASRVVGDLVTTVFILHYFERMGDALLNIGEAILFALLGERFKVRQYRVLDQALSTPAADLESIADVEIDSIWGTRSGVRIGKAIEPAREDDEGARKRVLFKEGNPQKLSEEKESLQRWAEVAPGLVPRIVEYQREGEGAALLLQFLDGTTFQDIVLNSEPEVALRTVSELTETLQNIWTSTLRPEPVCAGFMRQLAARLEDVYRLHPDLRGRDVRIGKVSAPSFAHLVEQAGEIDEALTAPFRVFIHGDFNADNIIINARAGTLHFVDVHRSTDMDYVQDVSVFLVSNFRLPVFVPRVRNTIERVSRAFLEFGRGFAARQSDATFEARLAAALARSFATSTRFELNRRFALSMQQRAGLLLDRLLAHRGRPWSEFRLNESVLLY